MATRSNIGIIEKDGMASMIYCHWDGYLSNNGEILFRNYTRVEKIRELLALGSISSLKEQVGPGPDVIREHSYKHPVDNVTIAYHRDRGERLDPPHNCAAHYARREEYLYLYDTRKGEWYACSHSDDWAPLEELLIEERRKEWT